jgi:uracil-DNA glycosylase
MSQPSLKTFLNLLAAPCGPLVFNPWRDHDAGTDAVANAPAARVQRLRAHLNTQARYLLLGEAPGYQGCHVTGLAFTSERLLMAGSIPRINIAGQRLSTRHIPWSEPSATTVWGTLYELGIADTTVLWNAFAWHPHKPGDLQTNRTPTPAERRLGQPVLMKLLQHLGDVQVLAVGQQAAASLRELGIEAKTLRHPSMGGAALFRQQLRAAVSR